MTSLDINSSAVLNNFAANMFAQIHALVDPLSEKVDKLFSLFSSNFIGVKNTDSLPSSGKVSSPSNASNNNALFEALLSKHKSNVVPEKNLPLEKDSAVKSHCTDNVCPRPVVDPQAKQKTQDARKDAPLEENKGDDKASAISTKIAQGGVKKIGGKYVVDLAYPQGLLDDFGTRILAWAYGKTVKDSLDSEIAQSMNSSLAQGGELTSFGWGNKYTYFCPTTDNPNGYFLDKESGQKIKQEDLVYEHNAQQPIDRQISPGSQRSSWQDPLSEEFATQLNPANKAAGGSVEDITAAGADDFEKNKLKNVDYDRPIVVTFGWTECGGCQRLKPVFGSAAMAAKDSDFVRIYNDLCPDLFDKYREIEGDNAVPRIKIFYRGEEKAALRSSEAGNMTAQDIVDWVNTQMKGVDRNKIPTPNLDKLTKNITEAARKGELYSVVGRDDETNQLIRAISIQKSKQNKPVNTSAILLGKSGVGKTSIVQNLALLIAEDEKRAPDQKILPTSLQNTEIHELNLSNFESGTKYVGEWQKRLTGLVEEVKQAKEHGKRIILFVDEIHRAMVVGTHSQSEHGLADALLTYISNGDLTIIGATTPHLYEDMSYKADGAFVRRLTKVEVAEPTKAVATAMLEQRAAQLEAEYGFPILKEAIEEALKMAKDHLSGNLPATAVTLLEAACKRVDTALIGSPAQISKLNTKIAMLDLAIGRLKQDQAMAVELNPAQKLLLSGAETERAQLNKELVALNASWAEEKALVSTIRELQSKQLSKNSDGDAGRPAITDAIKAGQTRLKEFRQGRPALASAAVDRNEIRIAVAEQTKIPVAAMLQNERQALRDLEKTLDKRIKGQPHATKQIAEAIRVARMGFKKPGKPDCVLMLAGPTGTGKTETAKALADTLYQGQMIKIELDKYSSKEEFLRSGKLVEIRRNPHCVVVLDEFDQARPEIQDLFYSVFDEGMLGDLSFGSAAILLTSNVGTREITSACQGKSDNLLPTPEHLARITRKAFKEHFRKHRATGAALLGRMDVIPYYPLANNTVEELVTQKLGNFATIYEDAYPTSKIHYDDSVKKAIFTMIMQKNASSNAMGDDEDEGVRPIEDQIKKSIGGALAKLYYADEEDKTDEVQTINISFNGKDFVAERR